MGTPSSSHIEVWTPRGSAQLRSQTSTKLYKEEAANFKAQDEDETRILSVSNWNTAGSVHCRIHKEAKRWLKLPKTTMDPLTFHYATDSIKQAFVNLIIGLLCTSSNVCLHTTCCPSHFDYLSKVNTYARDYLIVGAAEIA